MPTVIIEKIRSLTNYPFGRGALTSDGVQWSAEVDTTLVNTDVIIESATIEPIPQAGGPGAEGTILEVELSLTAAFRALFTGYAVWAASTAYALGAFVVPTAYNGFIYECTTAGTSGTAEPVWPTTVGTTVADGTVVWTCRGIDIIYKWQARNKGGTWVDLHPAVTVAAIGNAYVEATRKGFFKTVDNFDAIPFEVELLMQCNRANQGRAKTQNSSYAKVIYRIA